MRRRRRQRILIIKTAALCVLLVVLGVAVWFLAGSPRLGSGGKGGSASNSEEQNGASTSDSSAEETVTKEDLIAQADALAATYDYDGAIELLKSAEGSATDSDMIAKISEYTTAKDACVRVDINQVTHIFYHSLVVDPQKAFFQDNKQTEGFCEWMTTVEEFNRITQQMYDNGYVLVALHDLVKQTVDENGTVHFTEGDIYLPEGKKPYVLSLDDLSYYHSYDGRGIATKMVIDENGKPTCEYTQDDGTVVTGPFRRH